MRDSSLRRRTALTTAAIRSASGAGSRSSSVNTCRTWDAVTAGVFPPQTQTLGLQEPQRQQRQGHVVLPAHPTAHLVLGQPHLLLALLQPLRDALPRPCIRANSPRRAWRSLDRAYHTRGTGSQLLRTTSRSR